MSILKPDCRNLTAKEGINELTKFRAQINRLILEGCIVLVGVTLVDLFGPRLTRSPLPLLLALCVALPILTWLGVKAQRIRAMALLEKLQTSGEEHVVLWLIDELPEVIGQEGNKRWSDAIVDSLRKSLAMHPNLAFVDEARQRKLRRYCMGLLPWQGAPHDRKCLCEEVYAKPGFRANAEDGGWKEDAC